jgi:hypothetical protein
MIGISRIWQKRGKKIEILYNGQPCPDALKRFISEQALDEEDLEALEQHTEGDCKLSMMLLVFG